jgi:NADH-quinone oxidoreductase subunit L
MPDNSAALNALMLLVIALPAGLLFALGLASLVDCPLSEARTALLVRWSVLGALISAVGVFAAMLASGERHLTLDLGDWVSIHSEQHRHREEGEYHFKVKFIFDRLSVPFVMLSLVLCGTIGGFATRYMHREPGFNRFFTLYSIFMLGMILTATAGTIETLFAGWELVGLSSALLVAFFQERPNPARNGLRVWIVYRISDAALLLAAVVLHQMAGKGDFDQLLGTGSWPSGQTSVTENQALVVGLLLVVAAAGKSALIPFSGWLPRAMEGPTPSSAVFYGALSVHLGAYMLLRVSPLLDASLPLSLVVVALGLLTAVAAYLIGSVQTDIKSALSFASLAQVGIIVAEIGLGLRFVPLVHLLGHACLRTLQFVRAPSLLLDYNALENAIGGRLPRASVVWIRYTSVGFQRWLFRFALERGYLDALLTDYIATPFLSFFRRLDRYERRISEAIAGEHEGDSARQN